MLNKLLLFFCGLALAATLGCGSSGATLSGTVTYDGVPVENGQITFQPVGGTGATEGAEIVNGKYTATNLTPGKKVVTITSAGNIQAPRTSEEAAAMAGKPLPPAEGAITAQAVGNNQEIEVKSGNQTQDFALKKPA